MSYIIGGIYPRDSQPAKESKMKPEKPQPKEYHIALVNWMDGSVRFKSPETFRHSDARRICDDLNASEELSIKTLRGMDNFKPQERLEAWEGIEKFITSKFHLLKTPRAGS